MMTLRHFLETGNLEPIKTGITKDDALALLGNRSNNDSEAQKSKRKRRRYEGLKYGGLELGFDYNVLTLITLNFYGITDLPRELAVEGYYPNPKTTLEEFQSYLNQEGIRWKIYPRLTSDLYKQVCLEVGVGVHAYFRTETNSIYSLQFLNETPIIERPYGRENHTQSLF